MLRPAKCYHADQHAEKTLEYHCTDCRVMPCCAMLCYAMLCYAVLCYAMLCAMCYVVLCYAMLCYAMLCYAMPCHAMPCHAMPCYATLCYARQCSNVTCYAGDFCMQALWACKLPELSVDAGGHDTVDMEGSHRIADVGGMQHCLHQQHPIFLLLHQEGACSAHNHNKNNK